MKRARPEPVNALASGAEIAVYAWIEAGIATGEIATARGSLRITKSIPEPPPAVMTVVGFGDSAANAEFIERLLLDHASPGRCFIRYRDDPNENKLVRTIGDRSEVLVSYGGFNFDNEADREVLHVLELAD